MKKITVSGVIITLICAVIVSAVGFAAFRYLSMDRGMIGHQPDRTGDDTYERYSNNVNILLSRSENWHKISEQSILSAEDFAGIDGSTATIPITAELARQFCDASDKKENNYVYCYIGHNKTDVAYYNLIYRKENSISVYLDKENRQNYTKPVSLIFATPPSKDENVTAGIQGVTLEAEPVALDGFVFITHKDNPVDSLTVQQICDIYTGKITNWKQVGGKDEKIRAFQRTKNSGSQTAMEELVMNGEPMTEAPMAFVSEDMGSLVKSVAEYENESAAIGYTYYYYLNNLYRDPNVKVIGISGVTPENENLISEKYPFTTAYYAVMRADEPSDSVYRKLRDYLLTDEGQEIIELAGYCPVK